MKAHERYVRSALSGRPGRVDWNGLAEFHSRQTALMQHERFIHLLVTLAVSLFLLLSGGFLLVRPSLPLAALAALFLLLEGGYIIHYFRLENGVQRWYRLANELEARAGRRWGSLAHGHERVRTGKAKRRGK